jgi:mRNA interferase MazF
MRRGDLVTIALPGDYGKPRPALVIQSDLFDQHPSVTILPVTSELRETPLFRIQVEPEATNGLRKSSQVMVDKAQTVPREKIGGTIGRLDDESLLAIDRALAVFLGFAWVVRSGDGGKPFSEDMVAQAFVFGIIVGVVIAS